MSRDNGVSAFPSHGSMGEVINEGMTLRDYFAAKAMQAAISGHIAHYGHDNFWPSKDIASYAYEAADAMIAERAK